MLLHRCAVQAGLLKQGELLPPSKNVWDHHSNWGLERMERKDPWATEDMPILACRAQLPLQSLNCQCCCWGMGQA